MRRGSGEGEWPSFWVQFVSFHPAHPAQALTDVQRGSGAGPLIHILPGAAVTFVRQLNQTNATVPRFLTRQRERGREGGCERVIETQDMTCVVDKFILSHQ